MRVLIAGGKLQGVEAAYLAREARWSVDLIDKNPSPPARGLSDRFYQLNILKNSEQLREVIGGVDFVIPAIEDQAVLQALVQVSRSVGVPVACDLSSYAITSSKKKSDSLFAEKGIPAPRYWPEADFPLIAKPSEMSGSQGVKRIADQKELAYVFEELGSRREDYLIQEFLEGDSYSLEIIGSSGKYQPLPVTDLQFDSGYDCQRVLAPTALTPKQEEEFRELGIKIANHLALKGIMDIEVIDHQGTLKVLEIDARLPSQTPTVVYKSTGINMLVMLYELFAKGKLDQERQDQARYKGVIYEHLKVTQGDDSLVSGTADLKTWGEHIMAEAGPLSYYQDFFGADEALTDYTPDSDSWAATLIITGEDRVQAWEKRCQVIENIQRDRGTGVLSRSN